MGLRTCMDFNKPGRKENIKQTSYLAEFMSVYIYFKKYKMQS